MARTKQTITPGGVPEKKTAKKATASATKKRGRDAEKKTRTAEKSASPPPKSKKAPSKKSKSAEAVEEPSAGKRAAGSSRKELPATRKDGTPFKKSVEQRLRDRSSRKGRKSRRQSKLLRRKSTWARNGVVKATQQAEGSADVLISKAAVKRFGQCFRASAVDATRNSAPFHWSDKDGREGTIPDPRTISLDGRGNIQLHEIACGVTNAILGATLEAALARKVRTQGCKDPGTGSIVVDPVDVANGLTSVGFPGVAAYAASSSLGTQTLFRRSKRHAKAKAAEPEQPPVAEMTAAE